MAVQQTLSCSVYVSLDRKLPLVRHCLKQALTSVAPGNATIMFQFTQKAEIGP